MCCRVSVYCPALVCWLVLVCWRAVRVAVLCLWHHRFVDLTLLRVLLLLRRVQAATEAMAVYEALGRFGYTRYEVGSEVTVGEWLSQHKDVAEGAADEGEGEGSEDGGADAAAEATVSADGEWSV